MKRPSAEKHFIVSLVKSLTRIIGCGLIIGGLVSEGGIVLLMAEILGIVEEIAV
jgi:H+/gluconate symporter-like permease